MTAKRAFMLAIGMLLLGTPVWSMSGLSIGPLAYVDQLSIEIVIGQSLALDQDAATPLFKSMPAIREQFKSDVRARLTELLEKAGIKVTASQERVLSVSVFGGHFKASADNFYLVEAGYAGPDVSCDGPDRSVLGTAGDTSLAPALLDTVTNIVNQFLVERQRYRESLKSRAPRKVPPNPSLQRTRPKAARR